MNSTLTHLCRIAAALCRHDHAICKSTLSKAIDEGITATQIREVILTSYLFDGYPTALEGFRILSELPASQPIEYDDLNYSSDTIIKWRERGEKLCQAVYGPQFEPLMERVDSYAPELKDAMIVEGYGKVLSRDGLDIVERELCIVAMLVTKFYPRQLLSHALGALRMGATPQQLRSTLLWINDLVPQKHIDKSHEIIERSINTI